MDVRSPAVVCQQRSAESVSRRSPDTAGPGDREETGAAEPGQEQKERSKGKAGRTSAGPGRALSSAAGMRRTRSMTERVDVPFRRQGNRRVRTDRCDLLGEIGSWCDGEICILRLTVSRKPIIKSIWGCGPSQEDGACSRGRLEWPRLRFFSTKRHGR